MQPATVAAKLIGVRSIIRLEKEIAWIIKALSMTILYYKSLVSYCIYPYKSWAHINDWDQEFSTLKQINVYIKCRITAGGHKSFIENKCLGFYMNKYRTCSILTYFPSQNVLFPPQNLPTLCFSAGSEKSQLSVRIPPAS